MGRQVAILGAASTAALAPTGDPDWEVWGIPWYPPARATRLFDIHSADFWGDLVEDWEADISERFPDADFYCHHSRHGRFTRSVPFPFEEVEAAMPIPFFECTISYQLALAIWEGVERIGLWGVHMMGAGEYAFQRPSVTYLVGIAQGMGIEVVIPEEATLFKSNHRCGRYGLAHDEIFKKGRVNG